MKKQLFWIGLIVVLLVTWPRVFNVEKANSDLEKAFEAVDKSIEHNDSSELISLGKSFFFDFGISRNQDISCASCHRPEHSFAGPKKNIEIYSNGPVPRNVPSLANCTSKPFFGWASPTKMGVSEYLLTHLDAIGYRTTQSESEATGVLQDSCRI